MLLQALIFFVGLGILYLGAEWLIKGAAGIALRYGIRPMVVGVTVVALGTSMPEFVVNVFAAATGEDQLALGNIVGSNICNIGLILGFSALIVPLRVAPSTLKREYTLMMLVMGLFYVLALDGTVGQVDGLLLLAGLVAFFSYLIVDTRRDARRSALKEEDTTDAAPVPTTGKMMRKVWLLGGGTLLLAVGAQMMVRAAVNVAETFGIDPIIVGLTVVAIGTSLPELAASVVSAAKRESDISVGNVLGSNLLNVLFVIGLVAIIQPVPVDDTSLQIHFPVMMGFGALLLPLAWTKYHINRFEGACLLVVFIGYLYYLTVPYI